mgnify:FL=1
MTEETMIEKNLKFCIEECGMGDDEIGEVLKATENLKLQSVQQFFEEFVFMVEGTVPEDNFKYHAPEYLNIAHFNAMYWEQDFSGFEDSK